MAISSVTFLGGKGEKNAFIPHESHKLTPHVGIASVSPYAKIEKNTRILVRGRVMESHKFIVEIRSCQLVIKENAYARIIRDLIQ